MAYREHTPLRKKQGVTKRCRLPWLPNRALVDEPKCGGGVVARSQPMSTAVHNTHGSQINFGVLTPYLTYGRKVGLESFFFLGGGGSELKFRLVVSDWAGGGGGGGFG